VNDAREAQAIPCVLLHGATVTRPIAKGQLITTANTAVPANSKIAELRARQDRLVYGQ
jgi:predicted homoserine dehydrogenase-like protein